MTGAANDQDGVYVEVLEVSPGRDCIVTMALTQPVDAEQRAIHDCGGS